MKFTCEKNELAAAISVASRTVAPKNPIPDLEGILLRADSYLQLTGFNMETGITVKVEASITETGKCVLPARLFFDIIRKLPDDTVTITVDEGLKVSIRGGISSFSIMAISSGEDYPELPDVEYENGVRIPGPALRELISGTIFSVSDKQARPIHTGCLLEVTDDSVTMVAVDGFRLARRSWHAEEPIGRTMKFVVPAAALREVEKMLDDPNMDAVFTLGTKNILFEAGSATLICRLLEGEFLDWRRVVPTDNPVKLVGNVSALTNSIERVGLIINEKVKSPVRCVFSENVADFRTVTTIGAAHDCCTLSGDGKDIELGFNCKYLLDALRAVPTEEVTLEISNGLSPIVLTPADTKYDFAYMVMPVRLKPGE